MLAKRVVTAIIGILVAVYIINYGQWLFATFVSALSLIAWFEYWTMMRNAGIKPSFLLGFIGILLLLGCSWLGNPYETVSVITLTLLIVLAKVVVFYEKFSIADAGFTILGVVYIGLTFSHLILLRLGESLNLMGSPIGTLPSGAVYLWLAFLGTWASDTFAYFVGSRFGRTKLCPMLSPGKTREGFLGGLAGCILTVIGFGSLFSLPLIHLIMIGLLIGITAPIGDLAESALKRFCGVKDSGRLLPGHGGVLDRFDSIMFAIPSVYYYLQIFVLR